MGWTYSYKPHNQSVHEYFSEHWNNETERFTLRVLKTAVVKLRTAYFAVERVVKATNEREVFCVICKLGYRPHDHFNFGYKDMDETMGVYVTDCPASILDLLTPTDNENAIEWRKLCREHSDKRKTLRFKVGNILELDRPIKFTNGVELKRMKVKNLRPLELVDEFKNLSDIDKHYYTYYKCSRVTLLNHNAKVVA